MSDNNLLPKEDKVPGKDRPAQVGLRSSDTTAELSSAKAGNRFYWQQLTKKQKMIVGGITALVLLLVAVGVYSAVRSTVNQDFIIVEDQFELLPENKDGTEKMLRSGLSGRACETPDRRPIGVMLAGDPINRPVSGFAEADMVWELPVLVSNVTRLLAVYQCGQPAEIGSVRSVRHNYLFLAQGVDAIVGHWGGSYHALNRISVGEFQTISALSNPHNAFYRKNNLPRPYNGFTTYDRLWTALTNLGYRTTTEFEGYDFKDDINQSQRPAGGRLSIAWPGQYRVHYDYDPATNRYNRYWAGVRQLDGIDSAPVSPSAVVIMRAVIGPAPGPGGYNDVGIEGQGEMAVYQDGQEIRGTWKKDPLNKKDPVHFLNEQGEAVVFTSGQVWIMAVAPSIGVTWTVQESDSNGE